MEAPHSIRRQVGAGVLQDHGLVDHGQLQVRGGIVHRDAAGLGDQHDEQRGERQHLGGRQEAPALAQGGLGDFGQVGGAGADGHA